MAAPMTPAIWYRNGEWLEGMPFLRANDAGFVYGAVVSDRVRTFRYQPFRLDDHIQRFRKSCELARVPLSHPDDELRLVVQQLVAKYTDKIDRDVDFGIVTLATPGPTDESEPPTLIVHTLPLDFAHYQPIFSRGANLAIPTIRQMPNSTLDPAIKHRSRLYWWIARQQMAKVDATADALLLDEDGYITETASANVIVVKDGVLVTPPADSVLPGISLQTVREMCAAAGIAFQERKLKPEDCYAADEMLLTCTSWCMAGVSQLDGRPIPWPGPIYQRLSKLWSKRIGMDYVEQILNSQS